MALGEATKRKIQAFIDEERPFRTESLSGTFTYRGHGQFPHHEIFDFSKGDAWIYSYKTPIAVKFMNNWWVPEVYYSPTTTNHQNVVRQAIGDSAIY